MGRPIFRLIRISLCQKKEKEKKKKNARTDRLETSFPVFSVVEGVSAGNMCSMIERLNESCILFSASPMEATKSVQMSLLLLPSEVLYRLCDFLDTETIWMSFRCVCTKLFVIANHYNRYKISFQSLSALQMTRFIQANHIISLDFFQNKDNIDYIEALVPILRINKLTRLRSLQLAKTSIEHLNIFLDHVAIHSMLQSLTLQFDIPKGNKKTFKLLGLVISQPTLQTITLNCNFTETTDLIWPDQCSVKTLQVGRCTIKQLCSILARSPYLDTLIMDHCQVNEITNVSSSDIFPQLVSLTLNNVQITIYKLEFLLSLLPSIRHLDLTSSGKPFAFVERLSKWEDYIRNNLKMLDDLQFCIFCYCTDWENFETMVNGFRTDFWIHEKQWKVSYQFRDDWTSSFTIFTSNDSEYSMLNANHWKSSADEEHH